MIDDKKVITIFNNLFKDKLNTVLIGGADEPLYEPAKLNNYSKIYFRNNYVSSALHEISHWCIAGEKRRKLVDYGYWYVPDTRKLNEQIDFYDVEIKPQALEKIFSEAINVKFTYSLDNHHLDFEEIKLYTNIFIDNVNKQYEVYKYNLPKRAMQFLRELRRLNDSTIF